MAEDSGSGQKVLKSLALSMPPAPPALSLSIALAMALVPQSLAPVLKSLSLARESPAGAHRSLLSWRLFRHRCPRARSARVC